MGKEGWAIIHDSESAHDGADTWTKSELDMTFSNKILVWRNISTIYNLALLTIPNAFVALVGYATCSLDLIHLFCW